MGEYRGRPKAVIVLEALLLGMEIPLLGRRVMLGEGLPGTHRAGRPALGCMMEVDPSVPSEIGDALFIIDFDVADFIAECDRLTDDQIAVICMNMALNKSKRGHD